ncbi:transposase [Amycolatopsis sp. NPDC023774]|uniref:transposase n=1 Tax=Amycolatopsis sp. NPDC023774 TaxID=3155015 RepID=UPI0033DFF7A2
MRRRRTANRELPTRLACTTTKGRTLTDRELHLPKSWIADHERCRDAAAPDEIEFATKTTLANAMPARAFAAGAPARWVTTDEAYGQANKSRSRLEQHNIGYVVAVPRSHAVPAGGFATTRADHLVAQAPPEIWNRRSAGDGAKGPRLQQLGHRHDRRAHPRRVDSPARPSPDHSRRRRSAGGLTHRRRQAGPERQSAPGPLQQVGWNQIRDFTLAVHGS